MSEAKFGTGGMTLQVYHDAPRTGEATTYQSRRIRVKSPVILLSRGPEFKAGPLKVLTLMNTLLRNILEPRSFGDNKRLC